MDKHVWEVAKGKIVVRNGKIVSVSEPITKFCPVAYEVWGVENQDRESIRRSLESRMKSVGLSTPERFFDIETPSVGYGASESLMTALRREIIDATVTTCDGAGTVITEDPKLVQGIGMFMSGLVETSPIPEVIRKLEERGALVLSPDDAKIDQVSGVEKAFEMGHEGVGVTVSGSDARSIVEIRSLEEDRNADALVMVVHNTGVEEELAPFIERADIVYAGASKVVWKLIEPRAISTFGTNIPVYALTELGDEVLEAQGEELKKRDRLIKIDSKRIPSPLS